MRAASVYSRLQALMEVRAVEIDGLDLSAKYGAMAACHRLAIKAAAEEEAALVFLSPDALCADGTLAHALDVAATGKRAVMVAGLRVIKETFLPWFLETHYS